eukprot:scaffold1220_cov259-Pinguiococcus_pyrenoidosus.AAC.123
MTSCVATKEDTAGPLARRSDSASEPIACLRCLPRSSQSQKASKFSYPLETRRNRSAVRDSTSRRGRGRQNTFGQSSDRISSRNFVASFRALRAPNKARVALRAHVDSRRSSVFEALRGASAGRSLDRPTSLESRLVSLWEASVGCLCSSQLKSTHLHAPWRAVAQRPEKSLDTL